MLPALLATISAPALAEHYFGASGLRRLHSGAYRGTGAGLSPTGAFLSAATATSAKFGHIQVDPLGERCHCGNFGCLETVAANAAIEQRFATCWSRATRAV